MYQYTHCVYMNSHTRTPNTATQRFFQTTSYLGHQCRLTNRLFLMIRNKSTTTSHQNQSRGDHKKNHHQPSQKSLQISFHVRHHQASPSSKPIKLEKIIRSTSSLFALSCSTPTLSVNIVNVSEM